MNNWITWLSAAAAAAVVVAPPPPPPPPALGLVDCAGVEEWLIGLDFLVGWSWLEPRPGLWRTKLSASVPWTRILVMSKTFLFLALVFWQMVSCFSTRSAAKFRPQNPQLTKPSAAGPVEKMDRLPVLVLAAPDPPPDPFPPLDPFLNPLPEPLPDPFLVPLPDAPGNPFLDPVDPFLDPFSGWDPVPDPPVDPFLSPLGSAPPDPFLDPASNPSPEAFLDAFSDPLSSPLPDESVALTDWWPAMTGFSAIFGLGGASGGGGASS